MRPAENYADKTVDELLDADEDDEFSMSEEEFEEMEAERADMEKAATLLLQAVAIGQMFTRGDITLQQYMEMVEVVEDIADEEGVDLP